jgi:hypothetical protein
MTNTSTNFCEAYVTTPPSLPSTCTNIDSAQPIGQSPELFKNIMASLNRTRSALGIEQSAEHFNNYTAVTPLTFSSEFFRLFEKKTSMAETIAKFDMVFEVDRFFPWLNGVYDLSSKGSEIDSLMPILRQVSVLMTRSEYWKCDFLLSSVDFSRLNSTQIVGLLRICSKSRTNLPNWKPALNAATSTLRERSIDTDQVLSGLT